MAILLRQLCEKASYLYGMRVLAGENGTVNMVQWIHTMEDAANSVYVHGGELIFTTGIAQKGDAWLLEFVRNLDRHGASGLVVNVGPYIPEVPGEVIDYCNEKDFPLLEVPWKTLLIDITRDFASQIIENEKEEETLSGALKNIVLDPKNSREYLAVLTQNQFDISGRFCVIGIDADFRKKTEYRRKMLLSHLMRCMGQASGRAGYFAAEDSVFLVLNGWSGQEIQDLVEQIEKREKKEVSEWKIAVGKNQSGIAQLAENYRSVCRLLRLARRQGKSPLYYEKFGAKKILLSVGDHSVLEEYYRETLGVLERYDRENDTEYLILLQKYLEMDGSVQALADAVYVHRNTINYQLNKIKKILGRDFSGLQSRYELILAYQIKELL